MANEQACLLYDSVVFQHLVDREYVSKLIDVLVSKNSFRTFASLYNANVQPVHLALLKEKGWHVWHTETENLSFANAPHHMTVLRRG